MHEYKIKTITEKQFVISIKLNPSIEPIEIHTNIMRDDGTYKYLLIRSAEPIMLRIHNLTGQIEVFDEINEVWEGEELHKEKMGNFFMSCINNIPSGLNKG